VSYTPEYSFETNNLLSFDSGEDGSSVLGSVVDATPSVSEKAEVKEETQKETDKGFDLSKRRLLALAIVGFLCSLVIFYLTKNKKKTLMKSDEKK